MAEAITKFTADEIFTDAELFTMFNVDVAALIRGTNNQVAECDRLDPADYSNCDLWNVTFPRKKGVVDPSALSPEELQRCRKQEQAERAELLAQKYAELNGQEVDNLSSMLPEPTYR